MTYMISVIYDFALRSAFLKFNLRQSINNTIFNEDVVYIYTICSVFSTEATGRRTLTDVYFIVY